MSDSPSAEADFIQALQLSPRRSTSTATDVKGLVAEQLAHFSINPETESGRVLARLGFRIDRKVGQLLRSEEHTSELQSHVNLVCRLLLEKKKKRKIIEH